MLGQLRLQALEGSREPADSPSCFGRESQAASGTRGAERVQGRVKASQGHSLILPEVSSIDSEPGVPCKNWACSKGVKTEW